MSKISHVLIAVYWRCSLQAWHNVQYSSISNVIENPTHKWNRTEAKYVAWIAGLPLLVLKIISVTLFDIT